MKIFESYSICYVHFLSSRNLERGIKNKNDHLNKVCKHIQSLDNIQVTTSRHHLYTSKESNIVGVEISL